MTKLMDGKGKARWNPIQILDLGYYPQCYSVSLKQKHVVCFALCQRIRPDISFYPDLIFPVVLHNGKMTVVSDAMMFEPELHPDDKKEMIEDFKKSYEKSK